MKRPDIDHGNPFDWGKASAAYAQYRDIYPPAFYAKIRELGLCTQGQTVLDIGTGTGVLPRNLYPYGARFTGVDISPGQIAQARRLSEEAGMRIDYAVASAETADFPDLSFDVVTACQCFLYFDQDLALPNIHRLLKDTGHFCILFMAWLPEESDIARRSEELVLRYNPTWTGAHMRRQMPDIPERAAGLFEVEHALAYDLPVTFTRESWHGRMVACRGIGASNLAADAIARFEREHIAYLRTVPESFDILHTVSILNLRKRPVS